MAVILPIPIVECIFVSLSCKSQGTAAVFASTSALLCDLNAFTRNVLLFFSLSFRVLSHASRKAARHTSRQKVHRRSLYRWPFRKQMGFAPRNRKVAFFRLSLFSGIYGSSCGGDGIFLLALSLTSDMKWKPLSIYFVFLLVLLLFFLLFHTFSLSSFACNKEILLLKKKCKTEKRKLFSLSLSFFLASYFH